MTSRGRYLGEVNDLFVAYSISRERFDGAILDLDHEQLTWRIHPGTLTLGEMALHVAGVEVWFSAQLTEETLEGERARIVRAATEGCVDDRPFPFSPEEITPERVAHALAEGRRMAEPLLRDPSPELLEKKIVSALGPVIDGRGALARLSFHPAYHQGQAHILRTAPGFPRSGSR